MWPRTGIVTQSNVSYVCSNVKLRRREEEEENVAGHQPIVIME